MLVARIKKADLKASRGDLGESLGPIGESAGKRSFSYIILLSGHDPRTEEQYVRWLKTVAFPDTKIYCIHVRILEWLNGSCTRARSALHSVYPVNKENLIFYIVLFSALARVGYVFFFTEYGGYLFSDMGGYWGRALERYNGTDTSVNQWVIWPPFYHIFLSWLLKLIRFADLFQYKLEIVLVLHILLSAISVYFLYCITLQIIKKLNAANWVAVTYAFSYPLIYLNAFILTENFAIPLLIVSIWLLFKSGGKLRTIILSAFFLAIASAARPNYGLLGLPFISYAMFSSYVGTAVRKLKKAMIMGGVFALGFFMVLGIVVVENYRISNGRLTGLSANGGLTFYFAQTKTHRVDSRFDGWHYVIIPPSTVNNPENGTLETSVPFYNQQYYYKLGFEHLKKNPSVLLENLLRFTQLYWGPLMPSVGSAGWFSYLIRPSQLLLFLMTIPIGLLFIAFKNPSVDKPKLLFVTSIPVFLLLVHYFYNVEQRYLYSFAFVIHILFFVVLYTVITDFQKYKKVVALYSSILILIFIAIYVQKTYTRMNIRKNMKAVILRNNENIATIAQKRKISGGKTVFIDDLDFITGNELRHRTLGRLGFTSNFFIDVESELEVLENGVYIFKIYSDDGFRLLMDNRKILEFLGGRPIGESVGKVALRKGKHRLKLSYFQGYGQMGLKGFYMKDGDGGKKYKIGRNSPYVKFLPFE